MHACCLMPLDTYRTMELAQGMAYSLVNGVAAASQRGLVRLAGDAHAVAQRR